MSVEAVNAGTASASATPRAKASLRDLFDAQFEFVWRSVRRLGVDPAAADDATQEVFIVASRRLHDIEHGKERAFLFGTAVKVAADWRRGRARKPIIADTDAVERGSDSSIAADELTDQLRAREVLDKLLDEMDNDLRTVFVLFELEEMTMAEIASMLELPAGTVASRLRRARADWMERVARYRARAGTGSTL